MGKEFIEYKSENGRIPYSASTLCFCLTQYAKEYIKEKRKLTTDIDRDVRDAVLVDAINHLGTNGWCDFALYTKDLYDYRYHDETIDPQCLLTTVKNHYASYLFDQDIVASVLRNGHMNDVKKKFDANDGIVVLIDFINYIAERNDYDCKFTARELSDIAERQRHSRDMNELKSFLELTGKYTEKLQDGENIDKIYEQVAREHNLKYVSKAGVYYYTDELKNRTGQAKMYSWSKQEVEREIYAMTYAYVKINPKFIEQPETAIIKTKMKEMKKRDK